jgi:alpha-D-ribose 1-methylphosphonate 5-triphosphate diphosphatase PhnM
VQWERNGQELEVALFVRSVVDAEGAEATAAARTLVKQQMEALGISLPGLMRNRWRIAEMPAASSAARAPARAGLKVVQGGDAA